MLAEAIGEVVVIEPWSPWPLIFPGILAVVGIAASVVGTRYGSKPMRESGYVMFLVAALAIVAMTWSLSGIWDSRQRADALISLGYETPTFSGSMQLAGNTLAPLAWQAVRDGERVRGVLRPLGDDRWEVAEIEEE
ncbi:hypothetical protein [Agromyces sp. Soil535]|uniref:hypothetical protein n=1 Tax=Agromyces sp. Soil535 TaxID=1736390 RepID=UPI0006FD230A|nr:hypothetical protein [Agromyces sp. Soil535]KRE31177.1 hypothetical protein ASG80_01540 [Agromyces sp. Soil535]